jgi:hypothetical protein
MVTEFKQQARCSVTGRQVVLKGAEMHASNVGSVRGFLSCSNQRQCERRLGSIQELDGCRLHEVSGTPCASARHSPSNESCFEGDPLVIVDPDIADLVPGYLRNRADELCKLRGAVAAKDLATIELVAGKMVGGGAMFGFDAITELGRAIRRALARNDFARIGLVVARYREFLSRVRVRRAGDRRPATRPAEPARTSEKLDAASPRASTPHAHSSAQHS